MGDRKTAALAAMAVASVLVLAGPAVAESTTMTGYFAADARQVSLMPRLAVGRFGGSDGDATANAIERAIGNQQVEGRPFYRLVADPAAAMGVVSGTASTNVEESRDVRKREDCVEKTNDKCTKTEKVEIVCRRRLIDLSVDLRVIRNRDGAVVFSDRKTRQNEATWCPNEAAPGRVEETIRGMIDDVAGETARQITPHVDRYTVRFYESRTGMPKEIGERFKDAIRQTKADLPGACTGFAGIDHDFPGHFAVVYDLAVCAEARGDYQAALDGYRRAADIRPSDRVDFDAGMGRAARLIDGARDRAAIAPTR